METKKKGLKLVLVLAAVLVMFLFSCAPYQWLNPANPQADVRKDLADCVIKANVAFPKGNEIQRQDFIIQCMQGKGYYLSIAPLIKVEKGSRDLKPEYFKFSLKSADKLEGSNFPSRD